MLALLASTAAFVVALGLATQDEDLKLAGAIALALVVLLALVLRSRGCMRTKPHA